HPLDRLQRVRSQSASASRRGMAGVVRAGAIGAGVPHSDLWLSPDHSVLFDGAHVPVRHLINGASIAPSACRAVKYFHVELAEHGVLLAEGLPAESYLDTGNRSAFDDASSAAARR